jgi:hypothetical protein
MPRQLQRLHQYAQENQKMRIEQLCRCVKMSQKIIFPAIEVGPMLSVVAFLAVLCSVTRQCDFSCPGERIRENTNHPMKWLVKVVSGLYVRGRYFLLCNLALQMVRLDWTEFSPKDRLCIVGCSVSDISAPDISPWHPLSA